MTATDQQVLARQQERGWLLPYLLASDVLCNADPDAGEIDLEHSGNLRWAYWVWILQNETLPVDPIPQVHFKGQPSPGAAKQVQDWLLYPVSRYGWQFSRAWLDLTHWMLHGFGRRDMDDSLARIPDDVKAHWYRSVDISVFLREPCDWQAFVLQGGLRRDKSKGSVWASSSGFFSTPMPVCKMMTQMIMGGNEGLNDSRVESVLDPCCGTGSQLLVASNYSLLLYGQDIVYDLCLAAEWNGWLWMPWLIYMPDNIRAMLHKEHANLARLRTMRDFVINAEYKPLPIHEPVPVGIEQTDNETTVELAAERRLKADQLYAAASNGTLEQLGLFG